jgi:hypothetical protein
MIWYKDWSRLNVCEQIIFTSSLMHRDHAAFVLSEVPEPCQPKVPADAYERQLTIPDVELQRPCQHATDKGSNDVGLQKKNDVNNEMGKKRGN